MLPQKRRTYVQQQLAWVKRHLRAFDADGCGLDTANIHAYRYEYIYIYTHTHTYMGIYTHIAAKNAAPGGREAAEIRRIESRGFADPPPVSVVYVHRYIYIYIFIYLFIYLFIDMYIDIIVIIVITRMYAYIYIYMHTYVLLLLLLLYL